MADEQLAPLVAAQLAKLGMVADARLPAICALFKDRCDTTVVLAEWAAAFYDDVPVKPEDLTQHVTETIKPALQTLAEKLKTCAWDKAVIAATIKEVLTTHSLKMPQLAMPVRVLLMGTPQTPSLDAIIALFSREEVLKRLQRA
jgi:glutamyl-tRNA synthetase